MMIVIIMMMITMMMIIIMVLDSIVGQFGFFVGAVASGEKVLSAGEIAPSVIIPIILFIIIITIVIFCRFCHHRHIFCMSFRALETPYEPSQSF